MTKQMTIFAMDFTHFLE